MNNKWVRAAIPALLIHVATGTVYCWSTIKDMIAERIHMSAFAVGWAFSFAIFFLGMSAAFAGKLVEKNIHKSSLVSAICFTVGMLGTGLTIKFFTGIPALILIYLFYGCIMGVGLGIGYLTPVKTLMLWFKDNKGLATGISIMGFGLAKAIAVPIMEFLQNHFGITTMFLVLGCIYFVMIFVGHLLLKKPDGWTEENSNNKSNVLHMFKNKTFVGIWLMFYINIHCGLMIISYEKQILTSAFAVYVSLTTIISIVPSFTAGFNALGRIGYSTLSDKLRQRNTIYKIIFISSAAVTFITLFSGAIKNASNMVLAVILISFLLIINAGYGGGFSTLPALLSERFGMKEISTIHGLALSAWAVAGLTGNNASEIILKTTGSYQYVLITSGILYVLALIICYLMVKKKQTKHDDLIDKLAFECTSFRIYKGSKEYEWLRKELSKNKNIQNENGEYRMKNKYCHVCCNANVEPELDSDNDLSYCSVGRSQSGFNMFIRSGDGRPTELVIQQWDSKLQQNIDIGFYKMKYCPECGRKLFENER